MNVLHNDMLNIQNNVLAVAALKDCKEIMSLRSDLFMNTDREWIIKFREDLVIDRANIIIRNLERN